MSDELTAKMRLHAELCDYHDSLIATHRRLVRAAKKSVFAIGRATRIGRKIIARSRAIKAQATAIFYEVMQARASGK